MGGAVLGPATLHSYNLTERAFIITPWLLHCCRGQWLDDTKRILRDWHAHPGPVVVLRWDRDSGRLSRVTEREYPALRTVTEVLLQLDSREALDANILRMVEELPIRVPVDPGGAPERR